MVVATNQYVASGSMTLSGSKELTGRQLAAGDFTFRLTDVTDPENPVSVAASNDAFGDFSFDLNYDLADIGIHTYRVTEEDGGLANHDYDDTVFTVTVTVTDSNLHDGVLNVEKAVVFTDAIHTDEPAEGVLFANRYAATAEVPLSGTKELTGRALEAGEFAFQLYEETLDGPQLIQTAFSGAYGAFSFEPLLFDQDDIGMTYVYTLMEAPSAGPHGSLPNHTYDNAVYAITVTVGYDDSTGELTTEVHRSSALMRMVATQDVELEFTNAYAATAEVPLSGTKELTGRELEAGEFAFRLYEIGQEGSTLIQTVYIRRERRV